MRCSQKAYKGITMVWAGMYPKTMPGEIIRVSKLKKGEVIRYFVALSEECRSCTGRLHVTEAVRRKHCEKTRWNACRFEPVSNGRSFIASPFRTLAHDISLPHLQPFSLPDLPSRSRQLVATLPLPLTFHTLVTASPCLSSLSWG